MRPGAIEFIVYIIVFVCFAAGIFRNDAIDLNPVRIYVDINNIHQLCVLRESEIASWLAERVPLTYRC